MENASEAGKDRAPTGDPDLAGLQADPGPHLRQSPSFGISASESAPRWTRSKFGLPNALPVGSYRPSDVPMPLPVGSGWPSDVPMLSRSDQIGLRTSQRSPGRIGSVSGRPNALQVGGAPQPELRSLSRAARIGIRPSRSFPDRIRSGLASPKPLPSHQGRDSALLLALVIILAGARPS